MDTDGAAADVTSSTDCAAMEVSALGERPLLGAGAGEDQGGRRQLEKEEFHVYLST